MPFQPKVARIQRANQQLTDILGHSIAIDLDGSLLPQTHEGAQDVIAHLVEDVARDLDDLAKRDKQALAFARASFERLTVRYAPAEAAEREEPWRRNTNAKLDVGAKKIDLARPEVRWFALDRGEIATPIWRAFTAGNEARYANVLPDALPPAERRAWFDWHTHGSSSTMKPPPDDPTAVTGSFIALRVRGMIALARQNDDPILAKDARTWLIAEVAELSGVYYHHAPEVESAPPASAFRKAETAYIDWLRGELRGCRSRSAGRSRRICS